MKNDIFQQRQNDPPFQPDRYSTESLEAYISTVDRAIKQNIPGLKNTTMPWMDEHWKRGKSMAEAELVKRKGIEGLKPSAST